MAFSLVNGTGCQKSAQQDADFYSGIIGSGAIVLPIGSQCKAEIMSSNKIRVYDGEFISQGRRFNQPYGESVDFILDNGSQGTVRYDIIGLKFSRNSEGKESCETFVHKNVGASGTVYEEDIREGATSSYISMYRIKLNGINIESVTPLFEVIDPMTQLISKVALAMHPIGSIYTSINPNNPSEYFGGTWVSWGSGRIPVGVDSSQDDFKTVEKTGGEKKVTLTINEIPEHNHKITRTKKSTSGTDCTTVSADGHAETYDTVKSGNTGGGAAHNNMPPYITCYMWKRTA